MTSFISRGFSAQLLIILNVVSRDHLKTKSFLWSHMSLLHILPHVRSTFSIFGTIMAPWTAFCAPHVHFSANGTHSEPEPSTRWPASRITHLYVKPPRIWNLKRIFFHNFTWNLSSTWFRLIYTKKLRPTEHVFGFIEVVRDWFWNTRLIRASAPNNPSSADSIWSSEVCIDL